MRSNRRTKNRLMNDINVVPYIDVMLVLLVIFMVTAPMMNPGVVDLPSIGKSSTPPVAPMEVIIKRNGDLALRDHAMGEQEVSVSEDELIQSIKEKQSARPDQAVVISADKNIRYEAVMKVMDMLQQQQIQKIGLLIQTKNK